MSKIDILTGDCRDILPLLPSDHFDCVVTSPPYWGLRDYGVDGQIGQEPTLGEYLDTMVGVMRECRRALKPEGTCWLNIGDSYCNTDKWGGGGNAGKQTVADDGTVPSWAVRAKKQKQPGLKPKDLYMIPNRLAIRLQEDGWYVRSEIIWHKPNPMPESVKDRPTSAHEKVWLLTKSARYFYDAESVREPFADARMGNPGAYSKTSAAAKGICQDRQDLGFLNNGDGWAKGAERGGRNIRNVWTIAPKPFKGAHFAVMPPDLVERCIKAGCPVGGHVLDPFGGAGTTGLVAKSLGRNATLIEMNRDYCALASNRIGAVEQENLSL